MQTTLCATYPFVFSNHSNTTPLQICWNKNMIVRYIVKQLLKELDKCLQIVHSSRGREWNDAQNWINWRNLFCLSVEQGHTVSLRSECKQLTPYPASFQTKRFNRTVKAVDYRNKFNLKVYTNIHCIIYWYSVFLICNQTDKTQPYIFCTQKF